MRTALRRALGTAPESKWGPYATDEGFAAAQHRASKLAPDEAPTLNPDQLAQVVASALDLVEEPGELLLLATNSPFLLVGQTDAPTDAPRLDRSEHQLTAELAFEGQEPASGTWALTTYTPRPTILRLAVPLEFDPVALGVDAPTRDGEPRRRRITALTDSGDVEISYSTPKVPYGDNIAPGTGRRVAQRERRDAWHHAGDDEVTAWSRPAAQELIQRLRSEGRDDHADVILAAAGHDGTITRSQVYRICRYDQARTLRGFTRPASRISIDLVDEGLLANEAEWPLLPIYDSGPRASRFEVPPEFVEIFSSRELF